jgi:hypothetical protein
MIPINVKAILVTLAVLAIFGSGYRLGYSRYLEYKEQVEVAAKAQEAHNIEVEKQQTLVNQGIKNEYEGKLAAVRNYYAVGVRNPSGSSVSGISPAPRGTDAETAYPILVEQCAETTLKVNLWQEWAEKNGLVRQ